MSRTGIAVSQSVVRKTCYWFALAVAVLNIVSRGIDSTDECDLLHATTFSVKVILKIKQGKSDVKTYYLQEHYSGEQKRAKIMHKDGPYHDKPGHTLTDIMYYDAIKKTGYAVGGYNDGCRRYEGFELKSITMFLPDLEGELTAMLKFLELEPNLEHIRGPSRLLLVGPRLSQRLVYVNNKKPIIYRNRKIARYDLSLTIDSHNTTAKLTYFYEANKQLSSEQLKRTVPLMIAIDLSKHNCSIMVDFHSFNQPSETVRPQQGDLDGVDEFALPLTSMCSRVALSVNKVNLFEDYSAVSMRFSLLASLTDHRTDTLYELKPKQYFVAYDGLSRLMRVSSLDANEQIRGRVYDFKSNRKYSMYKPDLYDMLRMGFKSVADASSIQLQNRCVASLLGPPNRKQYAKFSSLLAGSDSFLYLGRARLHGLDTLVYESSVAHLPLWLGLDDDVYKDALGAYNYVREIDSGLRPTLSCLIYIVDSRRADLPEGEQKPSNQDMRLVAIDLYEHESVNPAAWTPPKLIMRLDFNKFLWDLDEAPSGAHADSLFSVRESCSYQLAARDGSPGDRYSEVDLLVTGPGDSPATSGTSSSQAAVNNDKLSWLSNPRQRNQAIKMAVSDTLDISGTMLYDIESRYMNTGRGSLTANFRVAEHSAHIYELNLLGKGRVIGESMFASGLASSFGQCFLRAASRHPEMSVYVLYQGRKCYIDQLEPVKDEHQHNANTSMLIKLDPKGSALVFRIDKSQDLDTRMADTWLRDSKLSHLEGRKMVFQNTLPDSHMTPINENQFIGKISKIKVKNFNYMQQTGTNDSTTLDKDSGPKPLSITGFTVTSEQFTKQVLSKPNSPISMAKCMAACVSDLQCQSYSFCDRGPDSVCLKSYARLVTSHSHRVLGDRQTGQSMGSGKRLLVDIGLAAEVEFVRQFECQICNKNYITFFNQVNVMQSSLIGMQIYSNETREECAERCFVRTLKAIQGDIDNMDKLNKTFAKLALGSKANSAEMDSLAKLYHEHHETRKNICFAFYHINYALTKSQQEKVNSITSDDSASRYCLLHDSTFSTEENQSHDQNIQFGLDSYEFDFHSLYDKQPGVRLAPSKLDQAETRAVRAIETDTAADEDYRIVLGAIASSKNIQASTSAVGTCAMHCFIQNVLVWPACRSFDVVASETNGYSVDWTCFLNTGTLDTVQQEVVITNATTAKTRVWHYGPKFGFIEHETALNFELFGAYRKDRTSSFNGNVRATGLGGFGVALLSFLALIAGLYIGVNGATRWPLRGTSNPDIIQPLYPISVLSID